MLKRALGVSLLSTVSLWLGVTSPSVAAAPDYSCYMQIGSAQFVDLTRSVCGFSADTAAKSAAMNTTYLNAVKKMVGSDERTTKLIEGNPELIIAAAQNYCAARDAGVSDQQFMEAQYNEYMNTTANPNIAAADPAEQSHYYETAYMATAVAVELAPQLYCSGGRR